MDYMSLPVPCAPDARRLRFAARNMHLELCALDGNERMLARGRTDGPHRLVAGVVPAGIPALHEC